MPRISVFISHMHEDRKIANSLEKIIDTSLLRGVKIFNSSNQTSIPPGKLWNELIIKELRSCNTLLAIATPDSVNRPWINFETGGAWANRKTVIPCCAKGMHHSRLPAPLSYLQAIDLSSEEDLRTLIELLAKEADLGFPTHFDFAKASNDIVNSWALSPDTHSPILLGRDRSDPTFPIEFPSVYWTLLLAIVQRHIIQLEPKTRHRIEKLRTEWESSGLDILEFLDTVSDDDRIVVIGPILLRAVIIDVLVDYGVMKPSAGKRAGFKAINEQLIDPFKKEYNWLASRYEP